MEGIWDLVGDQNQTVTFTANHWRAAFESIFEREPQLQTIDTVSDVLDAEVLR